MRFFAKRTVAIFLAILMLCSTMYVGMIPTSAASLVDGTTLYLSPNDWTADYARFAVYFYNSSGNEAWVSMTDSNWDGIYEVKVPTDSYTYTNLIFCRMNPSSSINSWDYRWNQTGDLTYDGYNNLYTIPYGVWDGSGNENWSYYSTSVSYTINYSTPSGLYKNSVTFDNSTSITMSAPSGTASHPAFSYFTFLGWSASAVSSTTTRPSYYANGSTYSFSSNATLYALYSYSSRGSTYYTTNIDSVDDVTIKFVVPSGLSMSSVTMLYGSSYRASAPTGSLSNPAYSYTFIGWAKTTWSDTTSTPTAGTDYLASGTSYYIYEDATYYALYRYTNGGYTYYTTTIKKATYSVSYSVPNGMYKNTATYSSPTSITLTAPSGTATNAFYSSFTFLGYTTSAVSPTATRPTYYAKNSSYTVNSEVTLYALYSYNYSGSTYYVTNIDAVPTVTISYVCPTGMSKSSNTLLQGGLLTASAPTGSITNVAYTYTFVGWAYSETTDTTEAPVSGTTYLKSGSQYYMTQSLSLYALFSYNSGGYTYYTTKPKTTADLKSFSLVGHINGVNVGCEEDAANVPNLFGSDNEITVTFSQDSYVFVKTTDNANWYMTDGWLGFDVQSAVLYNTNSIPSGVPDKLYVPAGKVTFTVVENANGTVTLSYVVETVENYVSYTFSTPSGVSAATQTVLQGKTITLPTPTGTPSNAIGSSLTFVGWASSALSPTTTAPTYYKAGDVVTASSNTTLYALYSYDSYDESSSTKYTYYTTNVNEVPTVTLNFSVPAGMSMSSKTMIDGGILQATAPNGTVSGSYSYTFVGWATASLSATTSAPYYLAVGKQYYIYESRTYYALFTYVSGGATYYTTKIETVNSYTVSYSTPRGVSVQGGTYNQGTAISLPTPSNSPSHLASSSFTFVGWTTSTVSSTTTAPTYYRAGTSWTVNSSAYFYALYSYRLGSTTYYATNIDSISTISINFVVPSGVTMNTQYILSGASYTFVAPSGSPSDKTYSYTFLGWAKKEIATTTTAPTSGTDYYTSNSSVTLTSDTTYYALYRYRTNSRYYYTTDLSTDNLGTEYSLVGFINGANVGCEEDANSITNVFRNEITLSFTQDSYVFLKTTDNINWYMTNGWLGTDVTSATLYNTNDIAEGQANKLFVPAGTVTFTVTENTNGSVNLSYVMDYVATYYSVTFSAPNGVSAATQSVLEGNALELPAPTGTPVCEFNDSLTFLGWTSKTTVPTVTKPTCYPVGSAVIVNDNLTYYALYSYTAYDSESGNVQTYYVTDINSIEMVIVSYVVPSGFTKKDVTLIKGGLLEVTAPSGTITGGLYDYTFIGYAYESTAGTSTVPKYIENNKSYYIMNNATYYALYTYDLDGTTYYTTQPSLSGYTVSYVVPDGAIKEDDIVAGGTELTLKAPTGTLTNAAANSFTFVGYTTEEVEATMTAPTYYGEGKTYTVNTDTTLYALYSYGVYNSTTGYNDTYYVTDIESVETVYVTFVTPDGVTMEDDCIVSGAAFKFGEPNGTPSEPYYNYSFVGWAKDETPNTSVAPTESTDYILPGKTYLISTNSDYFALYSYMYNGTKYYTTDVRKLSDPEKYCLVGNINGKDVGYDDDYSTIVNVFGEDNTFTMYITEESYVFVKTFDNFNWYMTNGWQGNETKSVTLYNTNNGITNADKLYVPTGLITFTLKENSDGTINLSYNVDAPLKYVTYTFSTPNGVTANSQTVIEGYSIVLPTPIGSVANAVYDYTFVGWSYDEVSDSVEIPDYCLIGDTIATETDETMYALYSYVKGGTTYYTTSIEESKIMISYSVPAGVTKESDIITAGTTVTFTEPTGTPTDPAYDYTFAGWSAKVVDDTSTKPIYYQAGTTTVAILNTTYYALYTYTKNNTIYYTTNTLTSSAFKTVYLILSDNDWTDAYIYTWNSTTYDSEVWPGSKMTNTGEVDAYGYPIYSYEVLKDYDSCVFNTGDDTYQTNDLTIDGNYYDLRTKAWYSSLNDIESPKVYFVNSAGWTNVMAYAWNDNGDKMSEWPGTYMTNTGIAGPMGYKVYELDLGGSYGNIIFTDGTNQTENLELHANKYYDYKNNAWYTNLSDITYKYTVVYSYNTYEGLGVADSTQLQTNTVTVEVNYGGNNVDSIVASSVPAITNPYFDYTIGATVKNGTTYYVNLVENFRYYSVNIGSEVFRTTYMGVITSKTYSTDQAFSIDGKVVSIGRSFSLIVTGDTDVTVSTATSSTTVSNNVTLDNVGLRVDETKVYSELLASVAMNPSDYSRMGVVYSKSSKSLADIQGAIKSVTSGNGVSNGIGVHNSSVTTPNISDLYQFTFAPYLAKENATGLYFCAYAVTKTGTVILSDTVYVDFTSVVA